MAFLVISTIFTDNILFVVGDLGKGCDFGGVSNGDDGGIGVWGGMGG